MQWENGMFFVGPVFALDTSHLLDGKTFAGFNGEKGKELDPNENEEIVFNFSDVTYSARAVGDSVHFQAVTVSRTHGSIAWQGVVHGDLAEVTLVLENVGEDR